MQLEPALVLRLCILVIKYLCFLINPTDTSRRALYTTYLDKLINFRKGLPDVFQPYASFQSLLIESLQKIFLTPHIVQRLQNTFLPSRVYLVLELVANHNNPLIPTYLFQQIGIHIQIQAQMLCKRTNLYWLVYQLQK